MVRRLAPLLLALVPTCAFYEPTFENCAVKCSASSTCPKGLVCVDGECRSKDLSVACSCTPGAVRSCGGALGECKPGVQSCGADHTWNQTCVGEGRSQTETCDGLDNDCDGLVDNALKNLPPCARTQGVCVGSTRACVDGGVALVCAEADYGATFEVSERACDGLDNDCDGLVDLMPERSLATNTIYDYSLFGYDGGFALVHRKALADGGTGVFVSRFDEALLPLGAPVGVHEGLVDDLSSSAAQQDVYVAWLAQSSLTAARVDVAGGVTTFPALTDAGLALLVRVGVSEQLVAGTYTYPNGPGADGEALVVLWDLDGGLARTKQLTGAGTPIQGFDPSSLNVSREGRYVTFQGIPRDDAGTTTSRYVAEHVPELVPLTIGLGHYVTTQARMFERGAALVNAYTYSSAQFSWSGVYVDEDLLGTTGEFTVVETRQDYLAWGESDATLDARGEIVVLFENHARERLVLARSKGTLGSFDVSPVLELPTDAGFGRPRLARGGDPRRLAFAWAPFGKSLIQGRLVCEP